MGIDITSVDVEIEHLTLSKLRECPSWDLSTAFMRKAEERDQRNAPTSPDDFVLLLVIGNTASCGDTDAEIARQVFRKLAEVIATMPGNQRKFAVIPGAPPGQDRKKDLFEIWRETFGIYDSPLARELNSLVVARPGPVLLEGATGTGKSEAAKLIHSHLAHNAMTMKKGSPIEIANIAATNQGTLRSEMRGYMKGAFTDAKNDTPGWFEKANGGVLFLDEFQDAQPDAQVALLDLLSATTDSVEVTRIGGKAPVSLRVKTVLAINQPLEDLIQSNRLRPDLVYRIRTRLKIPKVNAQTDFHRIAWRVRMETAMPYSRCLELRKIAKMPSTPIRAGIATSTLPEMLHMNYGDKAYFVQLTEDAANWMSARNWPGNYREVSRLLDDALRECHTTQDIWITPDTLELVQRYSVTATSIGETEKFQQSTDVENQLNDSTFDVEASVAKIIERVLIDSDFNFTIARQKLKPIHCSDPRSLAKAITKYRYLFSLSTQKRLPQ